MSRKYEYTNADGLLVQSGPITGEMNAAGTVGTKGRQKEMVMVVEAGNLQSVGTAVTSRNGDIPENAFITEVVFNCKETFDQAVEFGAMQKDGTAIDQDAFITTTTPAADTQYVGAGAGVGYSFGEVAYVAVTPTLTAPTTGLGELIVRYELV